MDDHPTLRPFASARQIADAVSSGSVSAVDVVEAVLGRIADLDAQLNAFTVVLGDSARADAAALSADRRTGPLAGVPVAIKDHIWLAGAPATNGSLALRDFVPDDDCVAVARLRQAGAVFVGKTNNPEFCYRGDTNSPVYGLTRNPWGLERTPGGSSGGSGAALAAGLVPLAMGTDGGGSIRGPSAFCGTVGHKPTLGLVPVRPGFRGWPTLSVQGPMGRSVGDVALMLAVMAGEHPADPSSFPVETEALRSAGDGRADLAGVRVAFSEDFGFGTVDAEVARVFSDAVGVIEALGCTVVERSLPATHPVALWYEIADAESFASEGPFLAQEAELTAFSIEMIRRGEAVSAGQYLDAQERRRELVQAWGEVFDDVDVVISPGSAVPAMRIADAEADGDEDWWGMDAIANLTGQPVTSLPCGVTSGGLPVGIQVMGRRYSDAAVLGAAATIERALPSLRPPAPFGTE